MHPDAHPSDTEPVTGLKAFFAGAGLPVFMMAAAVVYETFLIAVVFAPEGSGPWAQFSREFKQWCFSYDPQTGLMEWATAWIMLVEPLFIASLSILLWYRALRDLKGLSGWLAHWLSATVGVAVALLAVGGLYAFGRPDPQADQALPFPGERIRTQIVPPVFTLTDQNGETFSLADMKGRVLLVTGIYATCTTSCPEILLEIRNLLDALPAANRDRLSVVAMSLNPEYETASMMTGLASAYGFSHPEFRYLNGEPAVMHDLLTRMQFSAVRNERTGEIDHANLFILIDADGKIAYRFNLDPRHQVWLTEAVLALTAEAGEASGAISAR